MQKNRALGGQASRETDGYGIDLKWQGTKSNWRCRSGLAGVRGERGHDYAAAVMSRCGGE